MFVITLARRSHRKRANYVVDESRRTLARSCASGALRLMMTNNSNASPTFHVYEIAKELARTARPLIERIERRDRSLADQARRAAQSVLLNVREANRRVGRDRPHGFRIAAGSADELVGALDVAEVLGYVAVEDLAAPLALADRVLAMLYRLANPRR